MTARDIAHRYARKAHMCSFNKHSDRHQDHSPFCEALCADIIAYGMEQRVEAIKEARGVAS